MHRQRGSEGARTVNASSKYKQQSRDRESGEAVTLVMGQATGNVQNGEDPLV